MIGQSLKAERWTAWHVVVAALMALLGVLATWGAWADIYLIATMDEEASHIFLVPIVALWLVWVRRMRFRHCRPRGSIIGPIFVAIGWLLSSYGFYKGHQSLWHGGSILVVIGCMLAVLGKQALFRFFPAFAVLVFLIPVPRMIRLESATPLQQWTATIAQVVLEICGVEVQRSGSLLRINDTPVNIVEACNGLRMVFALVLVSYAFGFGMPLRNSVRFLILLASPLAAIACNVVRILPTVWVYGYQSKTLGEAFHTYSGWLMLPVAFLILLGIIKLLRWAMIPVMRYTLASQ